MIGMLLGPKVTTTCIELKTIHLVDVPVLVITQGIKGCLVFGSVCHHVEGGSHEQTSMERPVGTPLILDVKGELLDVIFFVMQKVYRV